MSAATSPVVDKHQSYLKFEGRMPRTLLERHIAQADYRHRSRIAELKKAAKKLAQIDELLPALEVKGVKFQTRELHFYGDGAIAVSSYGVPDDLLRTALLAIGFKEVARKEYYPGAATDSVQMKYGRSLLLTLEVSKASASGKEGGAA